MNTKLAALTAAAFAFAPLDAPARRSYIRGHSLSDKEWRRRKNRRKMARKSRKRNRGE